MMTIFFKFFFTDAGIYLKWSLLLEILVFFLSVFHIRDRAQKKDKEYLGGRRDEGPKCLSVTQ